jgi:plasmid stabilization system protein ParE
MKYTVRLLAKASKDANKIYQWLETRSPQGAINWYAAFQSVMDDLSRNPLRFGFATDIKLKKKFRERSFKTRAGQKYRLIFTVDKVQVHIFRVRAPGQPQLGPNDLRQ